MKHLCTCLSVQPHGCHALLIKPDCIQLRQHFRCSVLKYGTHCSAPAQGGVEVWHQHMTETTECSHACTRACVGGRRRLRPDCGHSLRGHLEGVGHHLPPERPRLQRRACCGRQRAAGRGRQQRGAIRSGPGCSWGAAGELRRPNTPVLHLCLLNGCLVCCALMSERAIGSVCVSLA